MSQFPTSGLFSDTEVSFIFPIHGPSRWEPTPVPCAPRRTSASAKDLRVEILTRGHIDHFVAVEHLPCLGAVEIAFPGGDHDGRDAIADQVAERARHADEPVD